MAFAITIRDEYGDPVEIEYGGDSTVSIEIDERTGDAAMAVLTRAGAKQLRKVLKQFLRESKS